MEGVMLRIAYDREESTEVKPLYFVYDDAGVVIYKGTYAQCLCVVGGVNLGYTLDEIKDKSEDFI
jgi:hypothetical protein